MRDEHYRLACRAIPCTLHVEGVNCPTGPSILVHNDMQSLGKGMGIKSMDLGAAGCPGCHTAVSDGRLPRREAQWYTLRGSLRTIAEFRNRGWLRWAVTQGDLRREAI